MGGTSTSSYAGDPPQDDTTFYARVLHLPARPRARRSETAPENWDNVPVRVRDYRRQTLHGGEHLSVRVASASMDWKGEDRSCVAFLNNDDDTSYKNNHDLQFFCGVLDGHDGPDAANYCAASLLPHILMELSQHVDHKVTSSNVRNPDKRLRGLFRRFSKSNNNRSPDSRDEENSDNDSATNTTRRLSALQPHICHAFEKAQECFAASGTPPDLSVPVQQQTVKTPPLEPSGKLSTLMRRAFSEENNDNRRISRSRPGGTTACTLCIVSYS